jgi:hypothetical protein
VATQNTVVVQPSRSKTHHTDTGAAEDLQGGVRAKPHKGKYHVAVLPVLSGRSQLLLLIEVLSVIVFYASQTPKLLDIDKV